MKKGYLLGVDIGTYSSKGVLVDQRGTVVASHTVPHSIEIPQPGFVEHDAEKTWWNDFVEVTKNLLKKTGGIIQGMSGSPIIQNGKLVGAVTHVFVNDPTKGYAVYAEWMMREMNNLLNNKQVFTNN